MQPDEKFNYDQWFGSFAVRNHSDYNTAWGLIGNWVNEDPEIELYIQGNDAGNGEDKIGDVWIGTHPSDEMWTHKAPRTLATLKGLIEKETYSGIGEDDKETLLLFRAYIAECLEIVDAAIKKECK